MATFDSSMKIDLAKKTNWLAIYLVSTICLLESIRFSVINVNTWAYLKWLDPNVSEQFFGFTNAAQTICIILSSLFFGWFCNQLLNTKWPILAGTLLLTFNCLFYANLEFFASIEQRKWFLMVAQMLIGTSAGMLMTWRVNVAMCTLEIDRQKANSIIQFAIQIGSILGSGFILVLGKTLFGHQQPADQLNMPWGTQFNLYTGPVYLMIGLSLISFALIFVCFDGRLLWKETKFIKEVPIAVADTQKVSIDSSEAKPILDYLAIGACIFSRICFNAMNIYTGSLSGPYSMMTFGWDGQQTVQYSMILQGTSGICGLLVTFCGTFHLLDRLQPRFGVLLSMSIFLCFFVFTFPWYFLTSNIPLPIYKNTTFINGTICPAKIAEGCDPEIFDWCNSTPAINMPIYFITLIIAQGIGMPFGILCMDVLYSRLLGQIKQGTWQGLFIAVGDFINVGGPLLITSLYHSKGPKEVWLLEIIIFALGITIWGCCYRRLRIAVKVK